MPIPSGVLPNSPFRQSETDTLHGGSGGTFVIRAKSYAALSTNPVMRISALLISATRGHASQPKVLAMIAECSAT